ncbi:YihY/virulence factor BrkB family protein [Vaginisenegalia massiliensis]|uniref:YihY/virulence factor BrkB family protein n=1 Tax=Vaginisenegalia massiliensis TaxID=2058294 RepID=UPI000F545D6E|nr:YihY/virulence factor BrkB family protein [Vaginisenegalia massiliensis]
MEAMQPTLTEKLSKTFQLNSDQLAFGSYAAELSFFIIWAAIPILLAFANVIAFLPMSQAEIMGALKGAIPADVAKVILPMLQSYLKNTSPGVFSLGLVISLWPASNVFNTLQRILNDIYKAKVRKNFILARLFAYVATLFMVLLIGAFTVLVLFGETIYRFLLETFNIELAILDFISNQGWILGLVGLFALLVFLYHFIPNVKWPLKYAIPGASFALVGFVLVSQLFSVYMAFAGNKASGNSTIGVLIVVMIWLYFNGMVIAIGAYINVFWHDFKEISFWKMVAKTRVYDSYFASSPHFVKHSEHRPGFTNHVYKRPN